MITFNKSNNEGFARPDLFEIVSRREESPLCEQRESAIECFSTANNENFNQTLASRFGWEE